MLPRSSLFVLVAIALAGCGKPPPPAQDAPTAREVENPWVKAAAALRKDTDPATCRRVLNDLSAAAFAPGGTPLPTLADADRAALQTALGLTDAEGKEVAGARFTHLDAAHLAECFYLRDVAATLDAVGQSIPVKAERALALACRQVQQVMPLGRVLFLSPSGTLRRGSGGGLDRAVVFVALLRQLDVDAFLVGPPASNDWPPEGRKPNDPLSEPFWAVGVRDGTSVFLYEPLRGLPVPGPTAGKPATLADVKANPELLKPWATDSLGALPTADAVKASVLFPAVPMSAVSPRMAAFQQSVGNDLGVRAAVNWPAAMKAAAGCGATVSPWAPTRFSFTPARALRESLLPADGGTASDERRVAAGMLEQLPQFAVVGDGAERGLIEQLTIITRSEYARTLIEPAPRERLQRGQYADATQLLVRTRDRFTRLTEKAGGDPASIRNATDWLMQTNELYKKLPAARLDANTNEGQTALRNLEEAIQKKWSDQTVLATIIAEVTAEPVLRETTYLLALAKHEQAERAQYGTGPAEVATAKAAWAEANGWWQRYLPMAAEHDKSFPGRAAHAQALAARAAALAK